MVLKLTTYLRYVISNLLCKNKTKQNKTVKFRYLELFGEPFNFGQCFTVIRILWGRPFCDVSVRSYVGCLYLFWYVCREQTHSYIMVPIRRIGGSLFKFTGKRWPPSKLINGITKTKGLIRRMLRLHRIVWLAMNCIIRNTVLLTVLINKNDILERTEVPVSWF